MDDKIFDIAFTAEGKEYKGWVNPSDRQSDTGMPEFHFMW